MGVLQDYAHRAAQVGLLYLVDIDSVVAYFAVRDVVEAVYEVRDRRLACAGRADEGYLLAGLCPEADVVQHQLVLVVAEVHAVEHDAALQLGVGDAAVGLVRVLPGPGVGALGDLGDLAVGALLGVHELDVALVGLGLLVHEVEHTLRAGGGGDDEVDLHADLGDGLGEALVQADKGDDRADRDAREPVYAEHRADDGDERIAQPADVGVDGHEQVGVAVCLVGTVAQLVVDLVEVGLGGLLVAEDLDDLLAVEHLLDEAVNYAEVALLPDVVLAGELGEVRGDEQHDHCGDDGDDGQRRVEHDHAYERGDHGDDRVDYLRNALAEQLTQGVHVVGVDGHDVAVGVGVEILDGQPLHALEEVVTQPEHGALAHCDHDACVGPGGQNAYRQGYDQPDDGLAEGAEVGGAAVYHRRDVVVHQRLREGRADDRGDGGDEYAEYDQQEGPLVIFEHVADHAPEHGGGAGQGSVLVHSLSILLSGALVEVAAALDLGLVDLLVDGVGLEQVLMGVKGVYAAVVHDEDAVGVFNARDTLGDDYLGRAGDALGKGGAYLGVGGGVHGAGGVVEYEHLRALEQGAGDAQALLLAAGDVVAAALDAGVVAVGHAVDELVGAGRAAGLDALLLGGARVAPAQVVEDGAGEEGVLLQHDCDLIPQRLHVVVPDVYAAHAHGALVDVVEAADEVHEAALAGAGAADDAYRLAGLDVQVDVGEDGLAAAVLIGEADVVEVYAAVGDLGNGLGGVAQVGLLIEHLADTADAGHGHAYHDYDHGEHHEAHEQAHDIAEKTGEVAGGHVAGHYVVGAEPGDHDDAEVDGDHHRGVVEGEQALGLDEHLVERLGGLGELAALVVLTHEGLDHADGGDVLLHAGVQVVVLAEDLIEYLHRHDHYDAEYDGEEHHGYEEGEAQAGADDEAHGIAEYEHERGADGYADEHHERVLYIRDICGHPGDEAGNAELVDVGEREGLYVAVYRLAQVGGEAG